MSYHTNKYLTFAYDVELNESEYIPEGTIVEIYNGYQREDSTKIIYNNQVEEYMNCSFIEYR
jgi:hypothetical protein